MNSNNEQVSRVYPEWEELYQSFETALQTVWPGSVIPVEWYVHDQVERGHMYTDLPLRCSRKYHVPLETVHISLEEALQLPPSIHCSFVEGYANCRYTSVTSVPTLPSYATPIQKPELIVAVIPPETTKVTMACLRLYARALFQVALAQSLGYSVRLIAGQQSRTGDIFSIWKELVQEQAEPRASLDNFYAQCAEIAKIPDARTTVYLSPRSLSTKVFRSFSKQILHPESNIRMQCPTQRWCGDTLDEMSDHVFTLEGLWYVIGAQAAQSCDLSVVQYQEMANRAWFYESLFTRLTTLYQPEPGSDVLDASFEGVVRDQAFLPSFVRQCAVFGLFDEWFSCFDRSLSAFLKIFHSPDGRQRLNDDSLLPHEIQIFSGAHAYLSDIIKHNSRLLEVSISCEPL